MHYNTPMLLHLSLVLFCLEKAQPVKAFTLLLESEKFYRIQDVKKDVKSNKYITVLALSNLS